MPRIAYTTHTHTTHEYVLRSIKTLAQKRRFREGRPRSRYIGRSRNPPRVRFISPLIYNIIIFIAFFLLFFEILAFPKLSSFLSGYLLLFARDNRIKFCFIRRRRATTVAAAISSEGLERVVKRFGRSEEKTVFFFLSAENSLQNKHTRAIVG